MVNKIAAIVFLLAGTGMTALPSPALAAPLLLAQSAPSAATTASFAAFVNDVMAGRVPSNISDTMKAQSAGLGQAKTALAQFGTFKRLDYVREDTMQGYHRYHYTAVFTKGSLGVIFVTDTNGTIDGFFQDQPQQGQQSPQSGPPPPGAPTAPPHR
ncbi:MAG TPA: hypothetical protein VGX91_05730 [Candidatus Cybelea sp.]|jgi:hypothetical protein|nr:hypothetical protein [Candidatus Cybelea sp.]